VGVGDEYAAKPRIEIDGNPLAPEFEVRLERAVVDDHTLLPDMVVLRFRDPDRDLLRGAGFEIGGTVRVLAGQAGQEARELLITGEVTGFEAEFDASGSHAVVRGYDRSHRLHRGRRTETYRNVTDADIARTIAQRVGLEVGRIDETDIVHRHVSQANISDWDFLSARASEIGHEIVVVEGKLEFRRPAEASDAPQSGDLTSQDPLQLVLGADLDSFRPRLTSAEQVKEVVVRGWDPDRKEAVVGTAPAETVSTRLSRDPADLASRFGDTAFVSVERPVSSQNEVDALAKAIAEQIASSFAEAEGLTKGNPKLRAGAAISIGLTGEPFDGLYTVTSSRHVFDTDGYRTHFQICGRQVRSLLALAALGETNGKTPSEWSRLHGVVTGEVTNVSDGTDQGRVKLSFPWLSETYESDWVRVVQAGAGKERGFVVVPEVNDEVLVAFEHGDIRRPYVLGGLYNGVDAPRLGDGFIDREAGIVRARGFVSRKGHSIVFLDDDGDERIDLLTGDESVRVSLDQSKTTISIQSNGDVEIEGSGDISVRGRQVTLAAKSGVSIDGGSGDVTVKGTQVRLN
jgi:phage protein D